MRISAIAFLWGILLFPAVPADAEPKDDSFSRMTPSDIKRFQYALYELNYDITRWDGVMRDETRQAIREWQSLGDGQASGDLSKEEFDRLLEAASRKRYWGSISASTDGAFGSTWRYPSRHESEKAARARCTQRSEHPERCMSVSGGVDASLEKWRWIGVDLCTWEGPSETRFRLISYGAATYKKLRSGLQSLHVGTCRELTVIEAAGRHTK
jgi:hypothetical protein